jgi:hypothetical protein
MEEVRADGRGEGGVGEGRQQQTRSHDGGGLAEHL